MIVAVLILLVVLLIQPTSFEFPQGDYLVVGNCKTCLPPNMEQIVREFKGTVILFNNNPRYEGLNENTIMVCNSMRKWPTLILKSHTNSALVFLDAEPQYHLETSRFVNPVISILFNIYRNKHVKFNRVTFVSDKKRYTSGMNVILQLIQNGSNVTFTGFDARDESHTAVMDTESHDFDAESSLLTTFEKHKLIRKLI